MGFHFEGEGADSRVRALTAKPFESHEDPGDALVISADDEVQGIEIDGAVDPTSENNRLVKPTLWPSSR